MRILLSSNAPWCGTGYGVQSASLLPRLATLPVVGGESNLALFAWFGVQGGMTQFGPFPIYPGHVDPYGKDVIGHHARHFNADVVVTLIDVWTQEGVGKLVAPAKWLPWFPVDTQPVAPIVLDSLNDATLPLVYSRHGQQALQAAGVHSRYVPMGVEPDTFHVFPGDEPERFREMVWGKGCTHATAMVAANRDGDRKAFGINLRAWAMFADEYGPGARLYVHADPTRYGSGNDLPAMMEAIGLSSEQVIFPDRYSYYLGYPPEWMSMLYNAADVLLAASKSEGFGIPLIEAQACGTPVITTDWTSMSELVLWGTAVEPIDLEWSKLGGWWALPDVNGIRDALGNVGMAKRGYGGDRISKTSSQVHALYGWDNVVAEHWQPVLEEVADGLG